MQKALAGLSTANRPPIDSSSNTPAMQAILNQNPQDVQNANADQGRQDLNGWCEAAVEKWANLPQEGGTASQAWDNWVQKGKAYTGLNGAQPGDLLYFGANDGNSNEGHAAMYEGKDSAGNDIMISATDNGVQRDDVNQWSQNVAPLLGYVHPY